MTSTLLKKNNNLKVVKGNEFQLIISLVITSPDLYALSYIFFDNCKQFLQFVSNECIKQNL